MWLIVSFIVIGGFSGFLLRNLKSINLYFEKITSGLIYILLFFMGMSVGVNPGIMQNLDRLGLDALLICLFTISGSILLAFLYNKISPGN